MRTLARAQRQMAEAMALATLLRRGAEAENEEEVFKLVSTTAICLLGADVAGLVLHTLHKGSAWCGWRATAPMRGATATTVPSTRPARRSSAAPRGSCAARTGQLRSAGFPFFAAEEICLGVSIPLNPGAGSASRGALCLGWRLDVELTPAHLELCEALAAFSDRWS